MTLTDLLKNYFDETEDEGRYRVKKEYVVKLDFFTEDYVSSFGNNRFFSIASDNTYVVDDIDLSDIVIFKRI